MGQGGEGIGRESGVAAAGSILRACSHLLTFAHPSRAEGVQLGFDDPVKYIRDFGSKIPAALPSLLLDLIAKRRTEVEVINGAIPRVAGTLGMSAPVNETITGLVHVRKRQLGCS